jgi:hypothetical protein
MLARDARARGDLSAAMCSAQTALRLALQPPSATLSPTGLAHGEGAGGGEGAACDALLLLASLWAARGSLADAQRHLSSARTLARQAGMPRLRLEAAMAQATLDVLAANDQEASAAVEAALGALGSLQQAGVTAQPSAGRLRLRGAVLRADLALGGGRPQEAIAETGRASELLAEIRSALAAAAAPEEAAPEEAAPEEAAPEEAAPEEADAPGGAGGQAGVQTGGQAAPPRRGAAAKRVATSQGAMTSGADAGAAGAEACADADAALSGARLDLSVRRDFGDLGDVGDVGDFVLDF